jgi:hypothetical protein
MWALVLTVLLPQGTQPSSKARDSSMVKPPLAQLLMYHCSDFVLCLCICGPNKINPSMSTANAALSIEQASVVVAAVVTAAHFGSIKIRRKRVEIEEPQRVRHEVPAIHTCLGPFYI